MVFFNCNACGEALKKNQVDKHVLRCRNCQVLSCVDCGKDFWGNDYQSHTKCMTEEEKYCGQGYVAKVNKGEVKQEQWIEKVQSAIDKSASNPGLRKLLIRLKDYPNIPRKQQKFQNFLKNSLRIYDTRLTTQVWETLMAHSTQEEPNKENAENGSLKMENSETNEKPNDALSVQKDEPIVESENVNHKKSKREKKEERQSKANKKEKKDRTEAIENEENMRKSKKRKHRDEDANGEDVKENGSKKKKKKHSTEENIEETYADAGENDQSETEQPKKKKTKFNWELTILKVLQDKGEISIKKLRKKVLGEFAALDAANYSEDNLCAKFDKKVKKMPNVQVLKERAKLVDK